MADAAAIATIHVRSWIATYETPPSNRGIDIDITHRADLWERRLRQGKIGRQISVADENGAVVGFIYFGPSPDVEDNPVITGQVFSLHVEPELTNRGIGRRLIEHAVDELGASGFSSATLWVVAGNRASRGFYERLGWRPDGKRRWEQLAMEGELGDEVEVVRYYQVLAPHDGERPMNTARSDQTPRGENSEPKYYELRQWLRQHVDGLPPGTPVAPERALSERFNISRTTVRQALHDLAVEGRIVRMQGRGTFVAAPKVTQNLQLTSYTEDMTAQGLRPGSKLIDITLTEAEPDVAQRLGLAEGAPVVRIERVRYANDEPMAVETVYLDGQRFPEVGKQLSAVASLYSLLEEKYGVIPVAGEETIETVLAPPSASRLLGTDSSTPMLLLTRSSRDATGRPLEYVRSLYRGDRFRFAAKLTRPE